MNATYSISNNYFGGALVLFQIRNYELEIVLM